MIIIKSKETVFKQIINLLSKEHCIPYKGLFERGMKNASLFEQKDV